MNTSNEESTSFVAPAATFNNKMIGVGRNMHGTKHL